ncbi:MAG TPA: phospholipase C, phosphocholine-specific [Puia sp.]|nr:phospholipase C, phosphocholine-specific [Puia sp.]
MDTRREFIKKATLLSGMAGMNTLIPASIQRALAIDPKPGTTWQDAEHIVILMQENRSFDHSFGQLRGVRGFNDPRAIDLPNGNPVWLQSNQAGETYAPFHLDIKDTKATWMSSLPHSWKNQVGARNDGRYDQWLNFKRNSIREYADMPLTLGYYNRQDIPFYYELADGFTVCDQHFCSSLTGTTPNRLFFWTGTIRAEQNENSRANVWNEDSEYQKHHWKTFPEVLEENDISWKFYQNEISVNVGFTEEQDGWLSNFGDNPLEFFSQYNVRLFGKHIVQLHREMDGLLHDLGGLKNQLDGTSASDPARNELQKSIDEKTKKLETLRQDLKIYNQENFDKLSPGKKNLHQKAFTTNANDPDYHSLEEIVYDDNNIKRDLKLPKGDLLHQFREDVNSGNLPTVSWLAAPENLSDHPSSAWYGAWYVSELMDILTKNPEVWKKTIFILTYDENDGYFDHVPPFVAPHSGKPETGKASKGMDTSVEYVTVQQEKERNGFPVPFEGESPIGLGYRVPLIVASPWSRGGYVNSEVFDHTSTLQFLENFLSRKTGKTIQASDISQWRRTISGDLSSIFRTADEDKAARLDFLNKNVFMESIYNAKFKKVPDNFRALNPEEISLFRKNPIDSPFMAQQEKGIRPSNGLFYQLYADGKLSADKKSFEIRFESGNKVFGNKTLGSPFNVYAPGRYLQHDNGSAEFKELRTWAFAVKSSDRIEYTWPLQSFEKDIYHLRVYGPNGFFREFGGNTNDPLMDILCDYQIGGVDQMKFTGNIGLNLINNGRTPLTVSITDNVYKTGTIKKTLNPSTGQSGNINVPIDLSKQFGWYDFTIAVEGNEIFARRYAGRAETGESGFSDPFMGRTI